MSLLDKIPFRGNEGERGGGGWFLTYFLEWKPNWS